MRAGVRLSQVSAAQSCQYDQQRHDRGAHAGVGPVEQVCADERQQANPELDFSDVAEGAAALPKQLQQPQQQSCPQDKIPAGSEQTECCRGCPPVRGPRICETAECRPAEIRRVAAVWLRMQARSGSGPAACSSAGLIPDCTAVASVCCCHWSSAAPSHGNSSVPRMTSR